MRVVTQICKHLTGVILALVLLAVLPLAAQNVTGEIDGRVVDSSGAVIVGAEIQLLNADTKQVVRTVKTAAQGEYSAPLLPVGNYSITVKANGFGSQSRTGMGVGVGDVLKQDFTLTPASASSELTVTAAVEGPNLETAANAATIENVQVNELALNTRNFQQLVALAPGVAYNGPDQLYPGMTTSTGSATPSNFAVNGLQYSQLSWMLDGSDILNHNGNNQTSVYPNVDAVNEIKVIRNGYGAQYGGAGSAQVSIVSKSGGSAFHGDMFYFLRNQRLNANSFLNKIASPELPRPTLRYNNYGFTIGGPVYIPKLYPKERSKTFFFFSEELRRIGSAPTQTFTNYPTLPQTFGYFIHPVTGSVAAANSPYPGYNYQIQTISPTSAAYIKDIIAPSLAIQQVNSPTDPQGVILQQRSATAQTQELVRLDHQFNSKLSMFVRFIDDPISLQVPNQYNGANNGYPGVSNENVKTFGQNVMGHLTYIAGQNTVIEGAYSYQPYGINIQPVGTLLSSRSPDIQVTLPFQSTVARVPNLNINGPGWQTRGPAYDNDEAHQTFLNVTHVRGKHSIQFGGNYLYTQRDATLGTLNAGQFAFTGAKNATTGVTAYEASFAAFLTGKATSFTQSTLDPRSINTINLYETYVQDDWRATRRLNLSLGVRYSIYGQFNDENGNLGVFQPEMYDPTKVPAIASNGTICTTTAGVCAGTTPNPNYDPLNGITLNNSANSFGAAVSRTPHLNFAPRFGFAYDLFGDGNAALRGGYGLFYNQTQLNLGQTEVDANPAYVGNYVYSSPASMADPGAGVAKTNAVPSVYGQVRNWHQPYTQAWNLDLQIQLPHSMMLDIGYVGNSTFHLLMPIDLNQPLPGFYAAASGVTTFPGAGTATAAINPYRPYLGYETIFSYDTRGFADYNGLQAAFRKRFGKRSIFSANYSWAKSMSNTQTLFVAPQNTYDLKSEWGPSVQDRRQVFTANFVYELPGFKGKSRWLRAPFGGWEISGIVNAASGLWGTVTTTGPDPAGLGILAANSPAQIRPDQIGDPNNGPRTFKQFFNTAAFASVPAGQYRPGNERRGSVEGPGYQTWNIDFFRNFSFNERTRLQFRCEAFNLFNHVNYNAVNTNSNNTNFGQVTDVRDNRQMQLGVKLYF